MKHLLWGAVATALLACGGGARPATTPPPAPEPAKSACAGAAEHMVDIVLAIPDGEYTAAQRPELVRVLTTRCETDAWPEEAVACLTTATGDDLERCGHMLTEAQRDAVDDQMDREVPRQGRERELESGGDTDDEAGGSGQRHESAPPPPPDDPCGGGA